MINATELARYFDEVDLGTIKIVHKATNCPVNPAGKSKRFWALALASHPDKMKVLFEMEKRQGWDAASMAADLDDGDDIDGSGEESASTPPPEPKPKPEAGDPLVAALESAADAAAGESEGESEGDGEGDGEGEGEEEIEDLIRRIAKDVDLTEQEVLAKYREQAFEVVEPALRSLGGSFEKLHERIEEIAELAAKAKSSAGPATITVKGLGKKPKAVKGTAHPKLEEVLNLVRLRMNVLLQGPMGCGKSFLVNQAADVLDLPYHFVSCTAGMSESILQGWLLPIGDSGRFEYVASSFVTAYENGGIFFFDELDAADPNILLLVNEALANDRFSVPQRHDNPVAVRHENFVCVASANTLGNSVGDVIYTGRNQLDGSTRNRFQAGTVQMTYSDELEEAIVDPVLLEFGRRVRTFIVDNMAVQRVMSTRFLVDATKLIAAKVWDVEKAKAVYFIDWSEDEVRRFTQVSGINVALAA